MDVHNASYEPMDIDASSNSSTSKMEISADDIDLSIVKQEKSEVNSPLIDSVTCSETENSSSNTGFKPSYIKKYHINLEHRQTQSKTLRQFFIFSLFTVALAVFIYHFIGFQCNKNFDLKLIEDKFSKYLFGQERAAKEIIEALKINSSSKILFLYGATGVGKTYAASFIVGAILPSLNMYYYTMPSFANNFAPEYMLGITLCDSSVMVVDDLTNNDEHVIANIREVITKSENLGKNITIILIYNCDVISEDFFKKCDETFFDELYQSYSEIKAVKKFIKFDLLTDEHLKMCIKHEMGGKEVNEHEMENILKYFDVSIDGCKGVHTKIKFLNAV